MRLPRAENPAPEGLFRALGVPKMALAMRSRQGSGPATRDVVLISAIWLGFAGLVGLFAALVGFRRANSRPPSRPPSPSSAPDQDQDQDQDGKPSRSLWNGLGWLGVALLCAGALLFAYNRLNDSYVTAGLDATTNNLGAGQQVILTDQDRGSGVRWMVMPGYVGQLTVEGPGPGQAEVILPLDRKLCPALALKLKVTCHGGTITSVNSPVGFAWSSPQQLNSTPGGEVSASLDIQSSAAADGSVNMVVAPQTDTTPSLCFNSPLTPAELTVTLGPYSFPHHFTGSQIVPCSVGLPVVIGSLGSAPPAFEFGRVTSLTLSASGSAATLQGFTGQIVLTPGGTTVPGNSSVVSLNSRGATGLTAVFGIAPGTPTFKVTSQVATSVMTDGSQLLPSEWTQHSDLAAPVLLSLGGAGVLSRLALSWRILRDMVWRRGRKR
jgi:hypothetical protein